MLLRRFNQTGLRHFADYVDTLRIDKSLPAPFALLEDDALTEIVSPETECPDTKFANRLEAAKYIDKLLSPLAISDLFGDIHLWSWLSLRFFSQLRPLKAGIVVTKNLGVDAARFIPTDDYTDRHRHLLRNPWHIYQEVDHDEQRAMCFLVQPVYRPGDVVEQFASRQFYLRNKEIMTTMSNLVVDAATQSIRPNASSAARRLDEVLGQFDCTWDLGFVASQSLVAMLPSEFDELRNPKSPKEKKSPTKAISPDAQS